MTCWALYGQHQCERPQHLPEALGQSRDHLGLALIITRKVPWPKEMRQREDGKQNMGKEVIPPDTERTKTSCDSQSHSGVCDSSKTKLGSLALWSPGPPILSVTFCSLMAKLTSAGLRLLPPTPLQRGNSHCIPGVGMHVRSPCCQTLQRAYIKYTVACSPTAGISGWGEAWGC